MTLFGQNSSLHVLLKWALVDLLQVFVFLIPPNLTYMESLRTHHGGWGKLLWDEILFVSPTFWPKSHSVLI